MAMVTPETVETSLRRRAAVLAAALAAVALWGATPIVTKLAVAEVDALTVGLLRSILGGVAVAPLILIARLRPPRSPGAQGHLAVSALGGFVLFPLLFTLGVQRTTAAHGALVLAMAPVFTGLIAALLERRVPAARWWAGSLIAGAGTVLLVGGRFGFAAPGASVGGDLLVLAASVAAACGYVAGARAAREVGTWAVTFWGLLLGGAILIPLLPFVASPIELARASPLALGSIAYLAAMSSIIAYACWYWALAAGDIGATGATQFAQPVIGVVLAAAILGEALTWPLLLAGAVILAGVVLARPGGRPGRPAR